MIYTQLINSYNPNLKPYKVGPKNKLRYMHTTVLHYIVYAAQDDF